MRYGSPAKNAPVFRSAFMSPDDGTNGLGARPVIFDVLAPDQETSILPPDLRMVLHVNPHTMSIQYEKSIERIQTKGGYVEQHWGEGARTIDFTQATGGFKRLYAGLSNITGDSGNGALNTLGTRRETIAYDKYLDFLALFHNNGSVYDTTGQIVFQGIIKILFDGGIYLGWFSNFQVMESADKGFQFELTTSFTVQSEILRFRSMPYTSTGGTQYPPQQSAQAQTPGPLEQVLDFASDVKALGVGGALTKPTGSGAQSLPTGSKGFQGA